MVDTHPPRRASLPDTEFLAVEVVEQGDRRGFTPNELADLLRVSADRVRHWIKTGELGAIDTSRHRCGKPRYVVLPHHLDQFVQKRAAATAPKPKPRRRRQPPATDYYP